jgi:hypothetical protein
MELRSRLRVRVILLVASALALMTTAFGVLIAPSASAVQTIPYKINFQGRLTDNNGNALADGFYNVKFRIWTAASGGSNSWEGDRVFGAADNRIQIVNGLFNIQFGDTTLGDPALSTALFSGTYPLYLEVELPTPASATCASNACAVFTEGAMTPRQPLASAAYAFNSDTLDGLDSSAFGQISAANTFTGANNFTPAAGVGLTVRAAAATNSIAVKDASGTTQAYFDSTGSLNVSQTIQPTSNGGPNLGTTAAAFGALYAANIDSGSTTTTLGIGTTQATLVTLGRTTGTAGIKAYVGTGNFLLDGAASSTYSIAPSNVTGAITIGGTAQTAATTVGSSSATNIVNLGSGTGATTVNIATGAAADTINIGTAITSGAVNIGGASSPIHALGGIIASSANVNAGSYSIGGVGGLASLACSGGQYVQNASISSGLITAGSCGAAGGGAANTALSNLAAVAINASLVSAANNTLNLGSAANVWQDGYVANLDAGTTTTALTIGATNASSITIGSFGITTTTPGSLAVNSGTNVPTSDQVTIDNTSSTGITTANANALNIKYKGGNTAIESSGLRVDYTPGTASGSTWSGLRVVANATGALTGVNEYGLKLDGPSSPGLGNEEGAYIGTGWDIGVDVQSGGLQLAAQSQPNVPVAGQLRIWAQDIAGRVLPKWMGPSGVDTPVQAGLGFNRVAWTAPNGTANCGTGVSVFAATLATAGTCTVPALASTNLLTSVRSLIYGSGATAGTVAFQRQAIMQVWRGNAAGFGGFFYTTRFGYASLQAGQRMFIGVSDSTVAPTNVDPTTQTTDAKVGLGINTNTGNLKLINNTKLSAPTVLDLGASFPVNTTSLYELILFSAPNGTSIGYRVTNISTNVQTSGSLTTNLPANTSFMAPLLWETNNATAANASMYWSGWYLESDN